MATKYPWPKFLRKQIEDLSTTPMFVKTYEKHSERVILVTSEESLVDTMLDLAKCWLELGFISSSEDFADLGTFEEYFERNMQVSYEWFTEHFGKMESHKNRHLREFIEMARLTKKWYDDEVIARDDSAVVEDIINNGLDNRAAELYTFLVMMRYNDHKMFELVAFD